MMKEYFVVAMLMISVCLCSPPPPTFRVASKVGNIGTGELLSDVQIVSWSDANEDYQFQESELDSWQYWSNKSLYVSKLDYREGVTLKRIVAAPDHYTVMDERVLPYDVYDVDGVIQVYPAMMLRPTSDYDVHVTSEPNNIFEIVFKNHEIGSSFGCHDVIKQSGEFWEIADGPKAVLIIPTGQLYNISFLGYDMFVQRSDISYFIFDFPVVEFLHMPYQDGIGVLRINYINEGQANISISLFDSWVYSQGDTIRGGDNISSLARNVTLTIDDVGDIEVVAEPNVYFTPQVSDLGDWGERTWQVPITGEWDDPDDKSLVRLLIVLFAIAMLAVAMIAIVVEIVIRYDYARHHSLPSPRRAMGDVHE